MHCFVLFIRFYKRILLTCVKLLIACLTSQQGAADKQVINLQYKPAQKLCFQIFLTVPEELKKLFIFYIYKK